MIPKCPKKHFVLYFEQYIIIFLAYKFMHSPKRFILIPNSQKQTFCTIFWTIYHYIFSLQVYSFTLTFPIDTKMSKKTFCTILWTIYHYFFSLQVYSFTLTFFIDTKMSKKTFCTIFWTIYHYFFSLQVYAFTQTFYIDTK